MKTAGMVLAGGRSSRYGRPKMFELYNGRPFYTYSVQALAENQLDPLLISTNSFLASRFDAPKAELVIEQEAHHGPLYAIHHVMNEYKEPEWFFVLSADIPFVTAPFVQQLLLHRHPDVKAIIPVQGDKLQPLLALYHRNCLPVMDTALKQNKRSLMALLDHIPFKKIPFDPHEPWFRNINTEGDFKQFI